jgi:hypothetical protein
MVAKQSRVCQRTCKTVTNAPTNSSPFKAGLLLRFVCPQIVQVKLDAQHRGWPLAAWRRRTVWTVVRPSADGGRGWRRYPRRARPKSGASKFPSPQARGQLRCGLRACKLRCGSAPTARGTAHHPCQDAPCDGLRAVPAAASARSVSEVLVSFGVEGADVCRSWKGGSTSRRRCRRATGSSSRNST